MRYCLISVLVLFSLCLSSQELSEMRVVGSASRMGNEMVSHSITDANGEVCAGIVIVSDMDGLTFDSYNGIVKVDQSKPGESMLYVSPGERVVQVYKTGFKPLKIMLYESGIRTLESGQVWKIEVTGTMKLDMIPVVINTDPSGASIFIDDESQGTGTTHKVVPGKHQLRVEMQGYSTYEKEIEVDVEHILFNIELEEIAQQILTIKSVPPGATIFVNNMQEGKTDKQLLRYPGIYDLRLMLEKYRTVEEKVTVTESGSNVFSYNLEKLSATLTIQVQPLDAEVYLNSRKIEGKVVEISPGMHKLEVRHPSYEPESRTITAPKGQDILEQFTLTPRQGRFVLVMEPMDASATMLQGDKIIHSWTGSREFDEILAGEYQLQVSKNGYKDQTLLVRVDEGQTKSMTVMLEPGESAPKPSEKQSVSFEPSASNLPTVSTDDMVLVTGGTYNMGDEFGDGERYERPVHEMTVNSFYMGKYEITQQQWQNVMGTNTSSIKGDMLPVTNITFYNMLKFCNQMSTTQGFQSVYTINGNRVKIDVEANGYRLPTEAEWEYACKGGASSRNTKFSGSDNTDDVCWYSGNSERTTHPVGQKSPNEIGLYDMNGNVWEACYDWWDPGQYTRESRSPGKYPLGPTRGSRKIRRGGGYSDRETNCTVSSRHHFRPNAPSKIVGFRIVRNAQ